MISAIVDTTSQARESSMVCSTKPWTQEWRNVVFSNESRFCLQYDDSHIRVWRQHGERSFPAYILYCHTGLSPGVMAYGAIVCTVRPSYRSLLEWHFEQWQ